MTDKLNIESSKQIATRSLWIAEEIGGHHLMSTSNWKDIYRKILSNPNSEIHFNLKDIDGDIYSMVLNPNRSSTNWEIHELYRYYRDVFNKTYFHYEGYIYLGEEVFKIKP